MQVWFVPPLVFNALIPIQREKCWEGNMNQTERLDHAIVQSVVSSLLAIVAFLTALVSWIILLSAWPEWWLYVLIVASAVTSLVTGYKARRFLIDVGVYKHSNFYQGLALISFGCSSLALLAIILVFFVALSYLR